MDQALAPTVAQHAAARPPPPPRPRRVATLVIVGVASLVVGVVVGVAIRGSASPPPVAATPAEPPPLGHVAVSSKPVDSNVTVDGRFVGVTPVDRLDLDPGKHSVVIDVFGYQPYAGTLEVLPRAQINLRVLLAPLGGSGSTTGDLTGGGKATTAVIPATALAPATPRATAEPPRPARRVEAAAPPPRPRRDCDGERSSCHNRCDHAHTDCDFSCPGCSSCLTSVGWDECKRQCDSCRLNCASNSKFCQSGCDGQYDTCRSSQ